jgi:hypothetical protein
MKNLLILTILSISFSIKSFSQNSYEQNTKSISFNIRIELESQDCNDNLCKGKGEILIFDKKTSKKVFSKKVESLVFTKNETKFLNDSLNNFIYFKDLDFDGKEDLIFASNDEPHGLITVTEVYLNKNNVFIKNVKLTETFSKFCLNDFGTNLKTKTFFLYKNLECSSRPYMKIHTIYAWQGVKYTIVQENEDFVNFQNDIEVNMKYYKNGINISTKKMKFNNYEEYYKTLR